jgi:hypothetical protein
VFIAPGLGLAAMAAVAATSASLPPFRFSYGCERENQLFKACFDGDQKRVHN